MLFKQIHLGGIRSGQIFLAFRKWERPSVKKGSLIKTAIGQVEIVDISEISADRITMSEAVHAGHKQLEELIEFLNKREKGNIYKIHVRYHSPDPRIALREQTELSDKDFNLIKPKLERLDRFSRTGPWTIQILKAIRDNPKSRAADLARKMGKEKQWLKLNIRKLKNMGLTISHEVGYSLSPLGETFLNTLHSKTTE